MPMLAFAEPELRTNQAKNRFLAILILNWHIYHWDIKT
jgi:hypothetical protein